MQPTTREPKTSTTTTTTLATQLSDPSFQINISPSILPKLCFHSANDLIRAFLSLNRQSSDVFATLCQRTSTSSMDAGSEVELIEEKRETEGTGRPVRMFGGCEMVKNDLASLLTIYGTREAVRKLINHQRGVRVEIVEVKKENEEGGELTEQEKDELYTKLCNSQAAKIGKQLFNVIWMIHHRQLTNHDGCQSSNAKVTKKQLPRSDDGIRRRSLKKLFNESGDHIADCFIRTKKISLLVDSLQLRKWIIAPESSHNRIDNVGILKKLEMEANVFFALLASIQLHSGFHAAQGWLLNAFQDFTHIDPTHLLLDASTMPEKTETNSARSFIEVIDNKRQDDLASHKRSLELMSEATHDSLEKALKKQKIVLDESAVSQLITFSRRRLKHEPVFKVLDVSGPPHCRQFIFGVFLDRKLVERGIGSTKKIAKRNAAEKLLVKVLDFDHDQSVIAIAEFIAKLGKNIYQRPEVETEKKRRSRDSFSVPEPPQSRTAVAQAKAEKADLEGNMEAPSKSASQARTEQKSEVKSQDPQTSSSHKLLEVVKHLLPVMEKLVAQNMEMTSNESSSTQPAAAASSNVFKHQGSNAKLISLLDALKQIQQQRVMKAARCNSSAVTSTSEENENLLRTLKVLIASFQKK